MRKIGGCVAAFSADYGVVGPRNWGVTGWRRCAVPSFACVR